MYANQKRTFWGVCKESGLQDPFELREQAHGSPALRGLLAAGSGLHYIVPIHHMYGFTESPTAETAFVCIVQSSENHADLILLLLTVSSTT